MLQLSRLILSNDNELVINVKKHIFKEASKDNSNIDITYKTCALRCLADILEYSSSKFFDKDFESYWTLFIEKYFENDLEKFKELNDVEKSEMTVETSDALVDGGQKDSVEEIKKLKLSESKPVKPDDEDDNDSELFEKLRLICLETFGKSWPHNSDMQGKPPHDSEAAI
jgi:hypothetical protein